MPQFPSFWSPAVYCTLHTANAKLHSIHLTLHISHCALHTEPCTLYTPSLKHCKLYCTLHTTDLILNTEHSTLHTAHWTLHTAHLTVTSTVHCVAMRRAGRCVCLCVWQPGMVWQPYYGCMGASSSLYREVRDDGWWEGQGANGGRATVSCILNYSSSDCIMYPSVSY